MSLTENLNILSKSFPDVYNRIRSLEGLENCRTIKPETARSGMPTIVYQAESGQVYLHSKYDPVTEAERFIGQYKDVGRYNHVFFYGMGMGYHVEAFYSRWPEKKFTVYEPEQGILLYFLKERQLKEFPLENCKGIYMGSSQGDIEYMLQQYVNQINGEVLFVVLPSYERIFGSNYKTFLQAFRTAVVNKKESLYVRTKFQKLWTTNSLRNFKEVINSQNILQDKKRYFAGKPAIIAAAGPSLEDELENLHFIKEKGLAYIFSVGSAVNTLVSNSILPHAACIYDPASNTKEVIRKVKEQGLDIPLIFGSSVYYEALQGYPGCKLHILTSQDTVSQVFLKNKDGEELQTVIDSPSIAIIALQMLIMLGCTPVILVGQNFAYKDNRYYAQGIEYKCRSGELCSEDMDNALEAEDVYGGRVQTSRLFNFMRNQMEMFISRSGYRDIINATKGGARIKGTVYKPLEELLKNELADNAVDSNWPEASDSSYDTGYMISRAKVLPEEEAASERLIAELIDTLSTLKSENDTKTLQKALDRFEKTYNKLVANQFFNYIIKPMNRVQFEMVSKNITDISSLKDTVGKARFIAGIFGVVFESCEKDINSIKNDFYDIIEEILENDIKVMSFTIKVS